MFLECPTCSFKYNKHKEIDRGRIESAQFDLITCTWRFVCENCQERYNHYWSKRVAPGEELYVPALETRSENIPVIQK